MSFIIKLKCFFKIGCGVAIQHFMDENRFKVVRLFREVSNLDTRVNQMTEYRKLHQ
jgi:hypothetical protein